MNSRGVTGVFIDPPRRGEVVWSPPGSLVLHQVVPVALDQDWFSRGAGAYVEPIETVVVTYYLLEYAIGGRTFRIWSKTSIPDLVDEIKVIMTLIDMAPAEVRQCEAPELTIPVNVM